METENLLQSIKEAEIDSPASEFYVRSMVMGLNEEQLKSLNDYFVSNQIFNETQKVVAAEHYRVATRNYLMIRLHDKAHKRNEPVSQLLDWFKNKKRGKFAFARKQLHERFLHLDYEDQIAVIRTFLDRGGKQNREWCYNMLKKWWSEELEGDIIAAWNYFHEQKCGRLFLMHMPSEIIREHMEELSKKLDYDYLCERLVSEPWFEIDKGKLLRSTDASNYMWIISQSNSVLTLEESTLLLYQEIKPFLSIVGMQPRSYFWPYEWEKHEKLFKSNKYDEDHFFLRKLGNVENMLSSMCKMGLQEYVKQFLLVDTRIHASFISTHKHFFEPLKDLKGEKLELLYKKYALFLLKRLYDPYRDSLQVFRSFFDKNEILDLYPKKYQILEREEEEWGWGETELEVMKRKCPGFSKLVDSLDLCPF